MTHQVQWTAAPPVWEESAGSSDDEIRGSFRQPSILRFATDTFMEDFLALLDTDASRIAELVAQPETWRRPGQPLKRAPIDPVTSFARTLERFRLPGGRVRKLPTAVTGPRAPVLKKADPEQVLKLYQPAHQRYYLVAASLVCRQVGLPDRALDTTRDERVTFVMRRLLPRDPATEVSPQVPSTYDEYAFVTTDEGTGWQKVIRTSLPDPGALVSGEDQLPLFSATYQQDDGRKRRLLAGTVPVGRREAYLGGAPLPLPTAEEPEPFTDPAPTVSRKPPFGPREVLLRTQVIEPWKRLIDQAQTVRDLLNTEDPPRLNRAAPPGKLMPKDDADKLVKDTRQRIQLISWYVLLDFARYLKLYLLDVWNHVSNGQPSLNQLLPAERTLVEKLGEIGISQALLAKLVVSQPAYAPVSDPSDPITLIAALKAVAPESVENGLESVTAPYTGSRVPDAPWPWPPFLFPLADPGEPIVIPPVPGEAPPPAGGPTLPLDGDRATAVNRLARLIDAALPTTTTAPMPAPALAAQPIAGVGKPAWFVIRCVYERPRCGPLEPTVISEPTRAFQLAGFFDPDAPARQIRIAMPEDTSLAGLRKFDKGPAFMISDILCGQISLAKKLTLGDLVLSVLPWPFHRDLPEGKAAPCPDGMVCSFSMPDITILAFILVIIFATVLHSIFFWLPWFFTCFSLPGFKAKGK